MPHGKSTGSVAPRHMVLERSIRIRAYITLSLDTLLAEWILTISTEVAESPWFLRRCDTLGFVGKATRAEFVMIDAK